MTAPTPRTATLEQQLATYEQNQRTWDAVLSHELRSPLAAILGYSELLEEGTFGALEQRAHDAVRRIRFAAGHLLQLIEGIDRAAHDGLESARALATVSARELMRNVVDALHFDAEARGTPVQIEDGNLSFSTVPDEATRALVLALGAAIKASPGVPLRIYADRAPARVVIAGTQLDPIKDNPDNAAHLHTGAPLSGPGLRLALARDAARRAGGALSLHPDGESTAVAIVLAHDV